VKKGAIIGLGAVCFVVVFAIAVLALGDSGVDVVGNIVPFDCAKGWDDMRSNFRITNYDEFQKLSPEERHEIQKQEGLIMDKFHANWCYENYKEWIDKAKDRDGRLVQISSGYQGLSWEDAILTEIEYNTKFPDGAYQDW